MQKLTNTNTHCYSLVAHKIANKNPTFESPFLLFCHFLPTSSSTCSNSAMHATTTNQHVRVFFLLSPSPSSYLLSPSPSSVKPSPLHLILLYAPQILSTKALSTPHVTSSLPLYTRNPHFYIFNSSYFFCVCPCVCLSLCFLPSVSVFPSFQQYIQLFLHLFSITAISSQMTISLIHSSP